MTTQAVVAVAYVGPDGLIQLDDLANLLRRPAWTADAACKEHPYVEFFPRRGASTKEAKAVCAGCLVREDCLAFAYSSGDHVGIWGGLSERERRRARTGDPALHTAPALTAFRKTSRGLVPGPTRKRSAA
jgi:WhiB family redox-sensing transcriptional regulator